MVISEWLDDSPEEQERWGQEIDKTRQRINEGGRGIRNKFKRKQIGDSEHKTIIRLLTVKHGQLFEHWLYLPNGKRLGRNCAAGKDEMDNAIAICPLHSYVAAGNGAGPLGDPKLSHEFLFIALIGRVEKVNVQDAGGKITRVDHVFWMPEPQCFFATKGMAADFFRWRGNKEYPKGANGLITEYNFSVYRYQDQGDKRSDIRYKVEYYDSAPRPTHAFNDKNEEVEIDLKIANIIRDQIEIACRPSTPAALEAMLRSAAGQGFHETAPEDEEATTEAGGSTTATATSPPAPTSQPQSQGTSGKLSKEHDLEDESPTKPGVADDEVF
jgi:hypothetical protein